VRRAAERLNTEKEEAFERGLKHQEQQHLQELGDRDVELVEAEERGIAHVREVFVAECVFTDGDRTGCELGLQERQHWQMSERSLRRLVVHETGMSLRRYRQQVHIVLTL
jgi:AraC-like DNA-binding protein